MTELAVSTILDKAWETNSRALIHVRDRVLFDLSKGTHEWKTHESLNVLCIHAHNKEYYLDISSIIEIDILYEPQKENTTLSEIFSKQQ